MSKLETGVELPAAVAGPPNSGKRSRRSWGGGLSILAQGEPLLWLTAGGLLVGLLMIAGLIALVIYQGTTTFWPVPLVEMQRVEGDQVLGEVTRTDRFALKYDGLFLLPESTRAAAAARLNPVFRERLARQLAEPQRFQDSVTELRESGVRTVLAALENTTAVREAPASQRNALFEEIRARFDADQATLASRLEADLRAAVAADESGQALLAVWESHKATETQWLGGESPEQLRQQWADEPDLPFHVWSQHLLSLLSTDISAQMSRRLLRTGNFDLTNEHFTWVSDYEIPPDGETRPEWALLLERLAWGRFYGVPKAFLIDGQAAARDPAAAWDQFQIYHPEVRSRWRQRRRLETNETGEINRQLEEARLALRRIEMRAGKDSPEWQAAREEFLRTTGELDIQFAAIRAEIEALDRENERFQLLLTTADGQEKSIALTEVVRAYPANQLSLSEKFGIYVSRWHEFLTDTPREANSEGGVFPAIFGTVVMTLVMSLAVVPFGVLAALYLREYAKPGPLVSSVRIAVNNLAGVPSIVFGVFGLGFFCYIIGASLDQLFFESKLPNPTYGTGGLIWASLTLALLALPVVIVATEEALAAVPRSMREGSLACGATKWQTIRRIVLPRAMPGIMTGMILAMARGAGEVAPLMLVGAVKLAPELPVDGVFPYIHPERSFMHLGFHIYDLGFQSQNSEAAKPMVFTTTLLLIGIIALMNVLAIALRTRLRKKYQYSQF